MQSYVYYKLYFLISPILNEEKTLINRGFLIKKDFC